MSPLQPAPDRGLDGIRAGDWKAYPYCVNRSNEDKEFAARYGSVAAYKRTCALAYPGTRAQLHGGVCSTRDAHIMASQFIADLALANRAGRLPI